MWNSFRIIFSFVIWKQTNCERSEWKFLNTRLQHNAEQPTSAKWSMLLKAFYFPVTWTKPAVPWLNTALCFVITKNVWFLLRSSISYGLDSHLTDGSDTDSSISPISYLIQKRGLFCTLLHMEKEVENPIFRQRAVKFHILQTNNSILFRKWSAQRF